MVTLRIMRMIADIVVFFAAPLILNALWPFVQDAGQHLIMFILLFPLTIADLLFQAIDIFAGVATLGGADAGNGQTIFDFFFNQPVISRAFWGITMISVALCFGFSIFAVIRSMGDMEQKRPLGAIMGSMTKAMLSFLLVPIMCIVCINLSALVLRQINSLLLGVEDRQVSLVGQLFFAATTREVVNPRGAWVDDALQAPQGQAGNARRERAGVRADGSITMPPSQITWYAIYTYYLPTAVFFLPNRMPYYPHEMARMRHNQLAEMYTSGERPVTLRMQDLRRIQADFYVGRMLATPNFYVMFVSTILMVIMLCMSLLVFIQRIYELLLLYIVAPFFVAPMPLDDGEKFKAWREAFIGKTISGFSTVITIQIVILMMPLILNPEFVMHENYFVNTLLKALLIVGGLFSAYKSHTLIAQIVSPSTAQTEGATGGLIGGYLMGKALNPVGTIQEGIAAGGKVLGGIKSAVTAPIKGLQGIGQAAQGVGQAVQGGMQFAGDLSNNVQTLFGGGGGAAGGGGGAAGGGGGAGGGDGGQTTETSQTAETQSAGGQKNPSIGAAPTPDSDSPGGREASPSGGGSNANPDIGGGKPGAASGGGNKAESASLGGGRSGAAAASGGGSSAGAASDSNASPDTGGDMATPAP